VSKVPIKNITSWSAVYSPRRYVLSQQHKVIFLSFPGPVTTLFEAHKIFLLHKSVEAKSNGVL
jgi:hypothetical protein